MKHSSVRLEYENQVCELSSMIDLNESIYW